MACSSDRFDASSRKADAPAEVFNRTASSAAPREVGSTDTPSSGTPPKLPPVPSTSPKHASIQANIKNHNLCAQKGCCRERQYPVGFEWGNCCKLCFSSDGAEHDDWCNSKSKHIFVNSLAAEQTDDDKDYDPEVVRQISGDLNGYRKFVSILYKRSHA